MNFLFQGCRRIITGLAYSGLPAQSQTVRRRRKSAYSSPRPTGSTYLAMFFPKRESQSSPACWVLRTSHQRLQTKALPYPRATGPILNGETWMLLCSSAFQVVSLRVVISCNIRNPQQQLVSRVGQSYFLRGDAHSLSR